MKGPDAHTDFATERARIARSLYELAAERGFEDLAAADVAGRAGLTEEQFAAHFDGIDACIDAVWVQLSDEFIAAMQGAFAGDCPWRERLRNVAYFVLEDFQRDPVRAHFLVFGSVHAGELAQARVSHMLALIVDMVDQGRYELPDPDSEPRATAEGAVGAINKAMLATIATGKPALGDDLLPEMMYIAVLPYLGPEAAEEELLRRPRHLTDSPATAAD